MQTVISDGTAAPYLDLNAMIVVGISCIAAVFSTMNIHMSSVAVSG